MPHPNLFLIGAPKCGTTSLYDWLGHSPDVFTPTLKEPGFYHFSRHGPYAHRGQSVSLPPYATQRDAYLALFATATQRYVLDGSTNAMAHPQTAQAIYEHAPNAKIIAVIRAPVARAYSHFLMEERDGWAPGGLDKSLRIEKALMARGDWNDPLHDANLRQSFYYDALKSYITQFGPENVRIYTFDMLRTAPMAVQTDLEQFLNIQLQITAEDAPHLNAYHTLRFPVLGRLSTWFLAHPLRDRAKRILPLSLRDYIRDTSRRLRRVASSKPALSAADFERLTAEFGDDYQRTLDYAKSCGCLREA